MSLDLLAYNFNRLYTTFQQGGSGLTLVADAYDYLYEARMRSRVDAEGAIQRTGQAFQSVQEKWVEPLLLGYGNSLADQCVGIGVDEAEAHRMRQELQRFEKSTQPFLEMMQDPPLHAAAFIKAYFRENPFKMRLWDEWQRYRLIIKLECLSGSLLPLHDFMVMALSGQKPSPVFESWVRRFKEIGSFDQGALHQGLLASVAVISKTFAERKKVFSVVRLETTIWLLGHQEMMTASDPSHLAWRECFDAGSSLGGYTLAKRLNPKLNKKDRQWVFELQERDDVLLVIPQNRSVLHMRAYLCRTEERKVAEYVEIDPEGRFALVEKLVSNQVKLIQDLLQLDWTPATPLQSFGYDKEGNLKSFNAFEADDFDFNRIEEELVFGGSDAAAYSRLVKQSHMSDHPYFYFYREAFRAAAEGQSFSNQVEDMAVNARADTLYTEVMKLKERIFRMRPEKQFQEKIAAILCRHYDALLLVGRLTEEFISRVIAEAGAP